MSGETPAMQEHRKNTREKFSALESVLARVQESNALVNNKIDSLIDSVHTLVKIDIKRDVDREYDLERNAARDKIISDHEETIKSLSKVVLEMNIHQKQLLESKKGYSDVIHKIATVVMGATIIGYLGLK